MSRYSKFKVSEEVAQKGIDLVYPGLCKLRCTYMGGTNKAYTRWMEEQLKPLEALNRHKVVDSETNERIVREGVARHVVLEWSVPHPQHPDQWIVGTDVADEKVAPDSIVNRIKCFIEGPELLTDVIRCTTDYTRFREEELEAEAKN